MGTLNWPKTIVLQKEAKILAQFQNFLQDAKFSTIQAYLLVDGSFDTI